jgi:hypothetical protein
MGAYIPLYHIETTGFNDYSEQQQNKENRNYFLLGAFYVQCSGALVITILMGHFRQSLGT